MGNAQAKTMDPAEYEALKEQLRSEFMRPDHGRPPISEEMMTALKEELLEEMQRRESMRNHRDGGMIGSRLSRQDFKEDFLAGLEERLPGLPLMGKGYDKRRYLSDRQILDELRRELELDLKAQEIYRRHWQKHPQGYGRMLLTDLLREAEEEGYTRSQILQAVRGVQTQGTLKGKLGEWMTTPEGKGFKYGALAAVLAIILWPTMQKSLQPLLKWLVREGMETTENIQGFFSGLTEDLQDIFAEAQFERGKDFLDKEIAQGLKPDPGDDL